MASTSFVKYEPRPKLPSLGSPTKLPSNGSPIGILPMPFNPIQRPHYSIPSQPVNNGIPESVQAYEG
jgi:hypothetical protein